MQDYRQRVTRSTTKVVQNVKKHQHIAVHAVIFVMIATLLFVSSRPATSTTEVSYNVGYGGNTTVDEVSSAEVAASIAHGASLVIADNVSNLADSLNAQVDFATSNDSFLAKPQIVETNAASRDDITTYTTQRGDTISSVAEQFNVTSETIRWANNLTSDAVGAGKKLIIPPVNGVLHTVRAGETVNGLAKKYQANAEQIAAFNDAENGRLPVGERIVIPDGRLPSAARPTNQFRGNVGLASTAFFNAAYGGNGYAYGYCTWYVAHKRIEISRPIPRNLGNAWTWLSLARASGMSTGSKPAAGAIIWYRFPATSLGHVGFVERVNSDGSFHISEMNVNGWNVVSERTIPASEVGQYQFIY